MKKFMFFLSIITLLFIGCDDMEPNTDHLDCRNPIYPIMTTSGVNKLACKVNGKIWVSCTPAFALFDPPFRMGYDSVTGHFGINSWWITRDRSVDARVAIEAYGSKLEVGNYKIFKIRNSPNYIDINNNFIYYYIDTTLNNNLNIVLHDRINKVISGNFHFTAISESNIHDTIVISEGQFDGKY